MNPTFLLALSVLGIALGGCGTWFALTLRRKSSHFLDRAVRLTAEVVALVPTDDECVAPKYVFRDTAGVLRTVTSKTGCYPAAYSLGQTIEILFDHHSGESRIDDWMERRGAELIIGFVSVLTLAVGIGILIFYFSRHEK